MKEKYASLYDGVKIEDDELLESIRGANVVCESKGENLEYDLEELSKLVESKDVL